MKKSLYLSLFCILTFLATNAWAGAWLCTEVNSDMIDGSFSPNPDGVIDYASYITHDESGKPLNYKYDNDYDGQIDDITYIAYDQPGNTVKTETDTGNDGDIDFVEIYFLDENCFHVMSELYDGNGVLLRLNYFTYDSNGNCVKSEYDKDADGDIDSVAYATYDGNGNQIRDEKDIENDGDIEVVTSFTYNDMGDPIHTETVTYEFITATVTSDFEYTYDEYGNKIKEEAFSSTATDLDIDLPDISADLPDLDTTSHMINYYTWEYFENAEADGSGNDCGNGGGGSGDGGDDDDDGWKTIHGKVTYNGSPVCAMVLANGQYMFTCQQGDDYGTYELSVPLDDNDEITIQAFVSGLAPFRQVTDSSNLNVDVQMQDTSPESRAPTVSTQTVADSAIPAGWARIAGTVTYDGSPLCAMVLANGQYMFSCGDNSGVYDLTVPLDGNGQVTLFVFVSGLQPYRHVFAP